VYPPHNISVWNPVLADQLTPHFNGLDYKINGKHELESKGAVGVFCGGGPALGPSDGIVSPGRILQFSASHSDQISARKRAVLMGFSWISSVI
jgi:hypothetical protein